jgi:TonB-linked SusC/RagA family outer membrane protein
MKKNKMKSYLLRMRPTQFTKLFLVGILAISQLTVFAQNKEVSGTVTGADNVPLPGVTVVVQGTTVGVITDLDGKFQFPIPEDSKTLVFSYIGMKSQKIEIKNQLTFNVILDADMVGLDEVVVVGYGTQKKSDLTGSIVSVKAEDLKERPGTSMVEKMQGKASGVDITQSSGQPGSTPTVTVRGRRSFSATNDPLYVVDGIPLEGGINDINPNDIISIEILKDAASCAIYGSRGANGVIIVSTQRGNSSGRSSVSYNSYYGVTQVGRMVDVFDGEEFAEYRREAYRATDSYTNDETLFDAVQLENLENGLWYNYPDMIFNSGYKTDHQLSFSGGNKKTQFALSAGYFDEQGTIKNMDYTRYTSRINLDHQVSDWLKVGTSTTLSRSIQNVGTTNAISSALRNSPLGECYDLETGELVFFPTSDGLLANPLFDTDPDNYTDEYKVNRVFSALYGEANFLKYFKYRLNVGVDSREQRRGRFRSTYTGAVLGGNADALFQQTSKFTTTVENILTYTRNINDKHQFDFTVMQSIQDYTQEYYSGEVSDLPYETQMWYNMDTGSTVEGVGSQLEEWQLASFMGRLNYDYNGKYLVQATLRADGSSRLSDDNKWGYFPSAAIGWRIINEPWMQDISWLANLKLRTSYGVTGNTAIDAYATMGALSQTDYAWDETAAYGYALNDIPNPDLKWESTATFDAGIDFGLLEGRISGSLDFYVANTTDLLMERQLPPTSGYTSVIENIGATRNSGVELNLNTIVLDNPDGFNWTVDINWFANKEEIVELYGGKVDDEGNEWFIGEPITVFYDYEKIGIWQSDEEDLADSYGFTAGEIKVKDQDGDGVIDSDDRILLGSDVPDWSMGFTSRMDYKNFDFSFFVYTRFGSKIYSNFHQGFNTLFGRYNNLDVDYWTEDNPTNAYPRPNQNQESPRYSSSAAYFDGTFVKVRNITLGYTLPSSWVNSVGIENARIYFTADQPFTFSKYEGYDPEDNDGEITTNVPSNKAFLFGVNVTF